MQLHFPTRSKCDAIHLSWQKLLYIKVIELSYGVIATNIVRKWWPTVLYWINSKMLQFHWPRHLSILIYFIRLFSFVEWKNWSPLFHHLGFQWITSFTSFTLTSVFGNIYRKRFGGATVLLRRPVDVLVMAKVRHPIFSSSSVARYYPANMRFALSNSWRSLPIKAMRRTSNWPNEHAFLCVKTVGATCFCLQSVEMGVGSNDFPRSVLLFCLYSEESLFGH